ncbi:ribonuclease T2 family protein [Tianweitania sediminis]|uniref:Ribonuclease n=1 Tax=Tianweitania sediminis TaxID=1502156 RepID=A0A8J7RNH3_9HYPH|nr:ribonuclease [Tianweitania sediminis]MBP0439029.1 ribonuclease [Tianweitania sediminis]
MPRSAVIGRVFALFLGLSTLAACEPAQPTASSDATPITTGSTDRALPQGKGFDFYVLSLSWSPSYCQAEGASANRQQCGRRDPLGFVVHGLWPQFNDGYPEFCSSRESDRVPDSLVKQYRDLLPSAGLIGHQWRKHGTCSGLSQSDYFALTRLARERVTIPAAMAGGTEPVSPAAVEQSFMAANPGLRAEDMAVSCDDGLIREVRICLSRDTLEFRSCPQVDARGCTRAASMPQPISYQ